MVNRLAQSASLYLRKHAENPIDWWPWCDEALTTARRDNKPIFLSIGYSSCHWCTVMEGEAFSHAGIADYMNTHFLPIKVDREERPEIDSIYMQALQMMTGQGGWPLNIFLSPDDLVPFYGGTYFPVEPRYGRPGFLELIQAIRRFYDLEKTKLQAFKDEILEHLQPLSKLPINPALLQEPNLLANGIETSTGIISHREYGNSFPMIPYAELALVATRFQFSSKYDSKKVCFQRGLDLALGGICDQAAGGFHRYTVDHTWTVPHFEKMLYDNGQIVEYLANLWSAGFVEPAFERAIAGTVSWLQREMTSPTHYFYAAQDADNFVTPQDLEPEEGAFYVWSYDQLQSILTSEEIYALQQEFTITETGNFEGKNVLQRQGAGELSQQAQGALAKLFAVRYGGSPEVITTFPPATNNQEAKQNQWPGRIPPVTDPKMIVAWNSLMISGLARTAMVFQRSDYLKIATQAAEFILEHQWRDGRFCRVNYGEEPAVFAQSEDYAQFIKSLIDLHQATLSTGGDLATASHWLEAALKLQTEFDEFLWSLELGGYYNTMAGDDLLVRERSYMDNATPAANGIAISNLVRLALLTEDLSHLDRAEQALTAFSAIMQQGPQSCPSLFMALHWYRHHTLVRTQSATIVELSRQYFPTAVFQLEENLPANVIGLVCQGLNCQEPATSMAQLLEQLQESNARD